MSKIQNMTITEASKALQARNISPVELMQSFLKVSESWEDKLNVWVTMDPELAMNSARICESEISSGIYKGPLHGIPIGVKDIYFTKDMKTTCCSPIYQDFRSAYDSEPVKLLREAGAVIMGKTVTTQFACGDPPPTKNPWNLSRTPGGSSSGSAAGLASGYFSASLGSQTAGSVLRPAAYNGLVGLKPTHGLVSKFGVYPVAPSLDTMGWFTKSVEDSAILLQCLAKFDEKDEGSVQTRIPQYSEPLKEISPPRIGIVDQYYSTKSDSETWSALMNLIDKLSKEGAFIKNIAIETDFEEALSSHHVIMTSEGASTHSENFKIRPNDYAPHVRKIIETGQQTNAVDYINAKKTQRRLHLAVERALQNIDILLSPTAMSGAPTPDTTGQPVFQAPWTMAGVPSINLPYTLDRDGLPLGVQLAAKKFDEANLLSSSLWIEKAVNFSAKPTFV